MEKKITVLLVDDHSLVRRGFRRMLEDDEAIAVVGEAANGDEAVAMAGQLNPAVVVMDVAMPGMSGPDLQRELARRRQAIPIVFIVFLAIFGTPVAAVLLAQPPNVAESRARVQPSAGRRDGCT